MMKQAGLIDLRPVLEDISEPRPHIIAGPCSAESEQQVINTASLLHDEGVMIYRAGVWKPRTMPGSFEGVGYEGLEWLRKVKEQLGMYVATEVARREHIFQAIEAGIDILWIGARTTTDPFAMQEVADALADSGKAADTRVLVKNPVNPDINLWVGSLMRLYNAGVRHLGAVHRGFSQYGDKVYRNSPIWQIPIELKRRYPNIDLFCDPSHIGGCAALVKPLSLQACDMGFDGLIVECHCDPAHAKSDASQQITPGELRNIIALIQHRDSHYSADGIERLRAEIDRIDCALINLLAQRMNISVEIGNIKKHNSMAAVQPDRYNEIFISRIEEGLKLGLGHDFMSAILSAIHDESVRCQLNVMRNDDNNHPK